MLDLGGAFLPLQPLPVSSAYRPVDPLSPIDLGEPMYPFPADSCSLAALRSSLALPLRLPPRPPAKLEFVALASTARSAEWQDELIVRQLKRADVERVRQLQDACLPISYPSSFYTVLLTSPTSICLIAFSPSSPTTILGAVAAHLTIPPSSSLSSRPTQPTPTIYLLTLAVAPSARGRGLGPHLLRSACRALLPLARTARVALHVEAENEAALRMYTRLGMREKRRQRGFYSRLRGGGKGEAVEMEGLVEL
ncbi:Cysteine-rich protein 2-binding protein [Rhodotorula kratochvilovae]